MTGALSGVKILEIGLLVQGPQASAMLSDMGADVIKVELPQLGDHSRSIVLSEEDPRSAYFYGCNRGKRSVTVDLRTPTGVSIIEKMIKSVDVIISNFKPGTMDSWGLGYDHLSSLNPGLIWAAGSTFGPKGPDASREGADLAGQAAGGIISTIGHDGHPPSPIGVTVADHIASQNLTSGVLAALYHKERTGQGQRLEVSLLGGQIWAQASELSHHMMTGELAGRGQYSHPILRGLYGIFETSDGWIGLIGVPPDTRDAFFIAMEKPELSLDERFLGYLINKENLRELFAMLSPAFKAKTTDQWSEAFRAMGVRYAPVRNYQQVVADVGAWENGYFQKVRNAQGDEVDVVGTPIAMSVTPLTPSADIPDLGEHTEEILVEMGFSDEEISLFKQQQAI